MGHLKKFSTCFPQVSGVLFPLTLQSPNLLITTPIEMQGLRLRCFVFPSPQTPSYSRRHTSRVCTSDGIWVYWRCNGLDDVSRLRNLSLGGLFIATPSPRPVGMKAKLDFLVQEGQIRAEAVVRHAEPGSGLGLKFTAVTEQDWEHLAALLTRLQTSSRSRGKA
jgi:hypothetical protein